ncbi:hypothetical protein CWR44_09460 [Staphylococcus haemolyticus]|uniref:hypothetical protein n=1 Tax=Staphylococcus haemolyticus TaxID=1283 RepID=UPI000CEB61E9|nr:hypothetical protein [Staphylococcus haemolyticus]AVH47422.1 hypothetical protein CWR44_09460 [Staphylococcus haemolyticus]
MINENVDWIEFTKHYGFNKGTANAIGLIPAIIFENIQVDFVHSENGWELFDFSNIFYRFNFLKPTEIIKAFEDLCACNLLVKGEEYEKNGVLFCYYKNVNKS